MGRHGGINILHQKSWHVWRLDNRLTVERDELRHAAQERERLEAERQATFEGAVRRLKRRAEGLEEEEEPAPAPTAAATEVPGGSSSSGAGRKGKRGGEADKAQDRESSYKYGMVTASNLKQAEKDLDLTLKKRKRPEGYWGSGGLGTGPHINLFEEAELEGKRHLADHQKQLSYTARNNELAQKSKKALFSEFDEISSDKPWYMRPPRPAAPAEEPAGAGGGAPGSGAGSGLGQRWKERHGQMVLQVKRRRLEAEEEDLLKVEDDLADSGVRLGQQSKLEDASLVRSSSEEGSRERRKREKEEKRRKKRRKEEREAEELRALRAEREYREREERARWARLRGGEGAAAR